MITSKKELKEYLEADARNYKTQTKGWWHRLKCNIMSNPISEQKYICLYIKNMRFVEYYDYKRKYNILFTPFYVWSLYRLRK